MSYRGRNFRPLIIECSKSRVILDIVSILSQILKDFDLNIGDNYSSSFNTTIGKDKREVWNIIVLAI